MTALTVFLVLITLGLAAYGFYCLVLRTTKPSEASIRGCCQVLDGLRRRGEIDEIDYLKLRSALRAHGYPLTIEVLGPEFETRRQQTHSTESEAAAGGIAPPRDQPWSSSATVPPSAEPIIMAEPVGEPVERVAPEVSAPPLSSSELPRRPPPFPSGPFAKAGERQRRGTAAAAAFHPLDAPDIPVAPRKSKKPLSDMLVAFMAERNIRWGELASGILIVGSALGLVVSLREQLRDAIPYFPALLFLLITAAIHAAGVYTLRRWRLRNTSRGVLIIGLLLIPLNFLAACLLTSSGPDRRPITDPVYWVAVLSGTVAFSVMSWISATCLLRRRQWPLFVGVMGSSLALLVINRVGTDVPHHSLRIMLLSVLPTTAFVVSVLNTRAGQWRRTRWSGRDIARLWLNLAITSFAFVAPLGLILVRAADRLPVFVALTPSLVVALSLAAGTGLLVLQGCRDPSAAAQRLVATAVSVLAGGLAAVAVGLGTINPTVLIATSLLAAACVATLGANRHLAWLAVSSWFFLAATVWCAMNLWLGRFHWDQLTQLDDWQRALFSGESGWCLMTVGALVVAWHAFQPGWISSPGTHAERGRLGGAAGGLIAAVGIGLALAASLLHRQNAFDQYTASLLLATAAVAIIVGGRSLSLKGESGATLAAVMVVTALMHGLIWNPFLGARVTEWTLDINIRWELVAVISAVILGLAALGARITNDEPTTAWRQTLSIWGSILAWIAIVAAFRHLPLHVGIGTALAAGAALALGLLAAAGGGEGLAFLCCVATAVVVGFGVAEVTIAQTQGQGLSTSQLACRECAALAVWCIGWSALFAYGPRRWLGWLLPPGARGHEWVLAGVVTTLLVLLVVHLTPLLAAELFVDFPNGDAASLFQHMPVVYVALGMVAAAVIVGLLTRPQLWQAAALILLWTVGWCLAGVAFQPVNAVGTALRWLVPIGGAVGAVVMGSRGLWLTGWRKLRTALRLTEPRGWSREQTQQLIDLWLVVIGAIVLSITTVAVSQVMLHGATALGGPLAPSFFAALRKDVSYGGPIVIIVTILLWFAITERRSLLAMAGSGVYQYFVALAVVLLFLSPHPQLASAWFLNIMQAVSIGMSVYGLVWYVFRARIGGGVLRNASWMTALDVHVALNGVLVASLVVLIIVRFFLYPATSAGWINEAGGWLGFVALMVVSGLAYRVWTAQVRAGIVTYVGTVGLALLAFSASFVDRFNQPCPWYAFRIIAGGSTFLAVIGLVMTVWLQARRGLDRCRSPIWFLPILVPGAIAVAFATRGAPDDGRAFWLYTACLVTILGVCIVYGCRLRSAWASLPAAGLVAVLVYLQWDAHRWSWLLSERQALPHATIIAWLLLAGIWLGYYLKVRGREARAVRRAFLRMPNIVLCLAVCWLLYCAIVELIRWRSMQILATPLGTAVIVLTCLFLVLDLWNDRARWRVVNRYLAGVALALHGVYLMTQGEARVPALAFALALVAAGGGYIYSRRREFRFLGNRWGVPRLAARANRLARSLPWLNVMTMALVLLLDVLTIAFMKERAWRFLAAFTPAVLAGGFLPLSDARHARGMRYTSIFLLTLGGVLLSLADVPPRTMWADSLVIPTRLFVAFAVAVFVYGWVIPRRLSADSIWLDTIRAATVLTSVLAIASLLGLLAVEWNEYVVDIGCGMPVPVAAAVAVIIAAMISAMLAVAVVPRYDPLRIELELRKGYVFAAEVVAALLVAHAFFTMPFLFRLGIRQYWPYLVMLLAFAGVGMARLLRQRDLDVLAEPIFQTAAVIPLATAAAFWAVDSRAEASLVMLLAGFLYLLISLTQRSLVSGGLAVLFANLALWLFYGKFPQLAFLQHPQLWMIPPALSLLLASQLERRRLTAGQLGALRYACVAVIYVSSTSEIFLTGIGAQLWPPMVLALLAVIGVLCGVLLRVRAYLYLGIGFLLFAMTSMIAHAHRRFDHVWPWWAFGILLGTAILVMFGWFEKRRNDLPELRSRLRKWDY